MTILNFDSGNKLKVHFHKIKFEFVKEKYLYNCKMSVFAINIKKVLFLIEIQKRKENL